MKTPEEIIMFLEVQIDDCDVYIKDGANLVNRVPRLNQRFAYKNILDFIKS